MAFEYKQLMVVIQPLIIMVLMTCSVIGYIWIRKYLNLASKIKFYKKAGKQPVIISMQMLDGYTRPFVIGRDKPTFENGEKTYNFPTESRYYRTNALYECPELKYAEDYSEAIDPELHEAVLSVKEERITHDEDGNELKDEHGNKIVIIQRETPILPKRFNPTFYDQLIKWTHKLGMMAGQKNEKLIMLLMMGAAGGAILAAVLTFKVSGDINTLQTTVNALGSELQALKAAHAVVGG